MHILRLPKKLAFAALTAVLLAFVAWFLLRPTSSTPQADSVAHANDSAAEALATFKPVASSEPIVALRQEAQIHASQQQFNEAAQIAVTLSTLDVPDPIGELLQAFTWHLQAANPTSAEADLRRAITVASHDPRGHRSMAQLLNSEGRRFEAHQHVLALARLGAISPRELLSLIDQSGPFQLVSFDEWIRDTSGTLFDLGKARHQYIADEKPMESLATVNQLTSSTRGQPAVEAFRGRLIAETQDDEQFKVWAQQLSIGIDRYPEYWLAIGVWLSRNEQDPQAVRALGEALRLDPTDRRSLRLLSASLNRLGETEKALQAQDTLAVLDRIFRLAARANAEQSLWIAEQLQALTRPWESVAWYRHGFQLQGVIESSADELDQRVAQIREWENAAGIERIRDARVTRMLGFDIREFPMPDLDSSAIPRTAVETGVQPSTLKFRDVAQSVGVSTSFVSEYPLDSVDFYLYQANGGGLAALDYDLDGRCDLYVVQSGGDPNKKGSSVSNQLFRQLSGDTFGEVSDVSLTADRGYGQGVCAGDVNQDGLADLLIANIGRNVVYINQGDGTFRERSDLIIDSAESWTSSIAIGDLDGDQLPEIIEVNYVDDPLIYQRKCEGRALHCTPQRFRAATDRILRSAGDGTFRLWRGADQMDELPNYGFGAVVADFDGQNGNDLFISNDGDLNHYWKSVTPETSEQQRHTMIESAGIAGCSIGTSGNSQACMGIASGDFDRNGLIDLLITNFHNEPVNLLLQNDSGFFVDEALKYGLVQTSTDVLGFGTQATDFDNDGWLDVAILNGHIYDASYAGIPFRMTSQLLRGGPGAFSLQDAETAGPYWSREQLARTLALFDWNRDGRMDLVANHLDQPIAILQNESEAENWLQLELVGVASDRTAIGARVTVHADGQHWTAWQTGGDGYMCTNEPIIHFGIGDTKVIDEMEIRWPSGMTQTLTSIKPNRRYLIVENESTLQSR
jgi:tetratricopeptide (TPR) repeat protein